MKRNNPHWYFLHRSSYIDSRRLKAAFSAVHDSSWTNMTMSTSLEPRSRGTSRSSRATCNSALLTCPTCPKRSKWLVCQEIKGFWAPSEMHRMSDRNALQMPRSFQLKLSARIIVSDCHRKCDFRLHRSIVATKYTIGNCDDRNTKAVKFNMQQRALYAIGYKWGFCFVIGWVNYWLFNWGFTDIEQKTIENSLLHLIMHMDYVHAMLLWLSIFS